MISVSNLSIHFSGRYLFDNVSFTIGPTDRIGLIGRNGSGKSTLLKIIKKIEEPEEGIVSKPNDFSIGYLPQEGKLDSERTVYDEAATALEELKQIDRDIDSVTNEIAERKDYESNEYMRLTQSLSELNERRLMLGGGSAEAEIEQILTGLGFRREDFHRPVTEFSGGWQMRIEIAKILLARPNCILLDEPTNHLDIESIRWLEDFLRNYYGSTVIVSHDSRFLDTVTNRTMEISVGKIYDSKLSFYKFLEARDEQRRQQVAQAKNQQRKIAQTERFIERFRYKATLASRVQSRIKQLEKMDRVEIEEEDNSAIRLSFPEPPRAGRVVVEISRLSKSYGDHIVLADIDLDIERGEKVAFVGRNGEGKTTLSKIIAGDEDCEGRVKLGHNVEYGYFAQHQAEMLDGDATPFEIIDNAATGEMRTQVRNLLGAFLFHGEDVDKKVKVLSGGEKSRLAIAKLLLQPTNLLIMDEPTNHLDMTSKGVLKEALSDYKGALILVSHDRDFLEGLTTKTIEFRNNKIKEYPGGIEDFLRKQKIDSLQKLEEKKAVKQVKDTLKPKDAKAERERRKAFQRERGKVNRLIALCEKEIETLESRKAELEEMFAGPDFFSDPEASKKAQREFDILNKNLESKMEEWTDLQEELDGIILENF